MSDETKPQDSAAMPPASAGSHGPVAWWFKCDDYESATLLKEHADAMAAPYGTTPIPLYRLPTLTDEEREAVKRSVFVVERWRENGGYHTSLEEDIATLLKLLERTK